ncbi:hypothetical protein, partial [Phocaeicola plebeius]|uniref:hypothetical protein n=3 Tax=Phocaeicola plebeius TaxID=310297 RepID=UPI0026EE84B0
VVAVLTEALRQKRFRAFLCLYACVLFRSRPLLLFAAGFFLSFLFPLLSFVSLPLIRTAFRNAPGDVFSAKESHSLLEHPDFLRANENSLRRETILKICLLLHRIIILLGISDMLGM